MRKITRILVLLASATVALADNNHDNNHDEKLSKDLPRGSSTAWVDVIVQLNNSFGKFGSSDLQRLLKGFQDQSDQQGQNGQQHKNEKAFSAIQAFHLKIPAGMIPLLKANPLVKYISLNRPTSRFLDLTTAAVGANTAWGFGLDGTGVGVAVIDSGIFPDHDFTGPNGVTSRVVYNESFVTGEGPSDLYGHGTHVAGIAGTSGKDSTGLLFTRTFRGVAPNINLINLKVLDANGTGQESDVIDAIQRAIDLKNTYNIRVINLSLGRPVFESYKLDPLCQAVEAAWKAGIVVVVAAGNYGRDNTLHTKGYGTIASPGNDPYVITVGAMKANGSKSSADDTIASYSSKGPTLVDHIVKPDLVAPGNQVVSVLAPNTTLARLYPNTLMPFSLYETIGATGKSGDYFILSGTSMATPVVAGAAAILIQKNPSLTPDQVKARLMKTATKAIPLYSTGIDSYTHQSYNNQADLLTVGAGYLNIAAAISNNDLATKPALSPAVKYNPATRKISIVRDFSLTWGDSIVWGDSGIFGGFVFSRVAVTAADESVLWGDSVVWGDSTTDGFSVLWGNSVNNLNSLSALSADTGDE